MAVADSIEMFRRTFSYCDFVNPKGMNFVTRALVSNIQKMTNPDLFRCPFKKGLYKASELKKELKSPQPAPPFMKLGQRFDISVTIRSVITKKREMLCTVYLQYVISN